MHKASRQIVDTYQLLAVEKLNVDGMSKGRLAKSIYDAGSRSFLQQLAINAAEAGRRVAEVNPAGTSEYRLGSQDAVCSCASLS